MVCTCGFEWCWLCGMPSKSIFHYAQMGGLLCEIIAGSFFKRKPCCAFTLISLVFIFLPCIVLFFSCMLVAVGIYFMVQYLFKNTRCKNCIPSYSNKPGFCYRFANIAKALIVVLAWTLFIIIEIAFTLTFGTALAALAIVPVYIITIIVLIRLKIKWRSKATKERKQKQQS
jgi:amino acid transporter